MLENDDSLDNGYRNGPALPPEGAANLRKAGKWGRFMGIVSMAGLGLFILIFVAFGSTFMVMAGMGDMSGGMGGGMTVILGIYALLFAVMFYLAYLLYSFGTDAMQAVDQGNTQAMVSSFGSLGRLFKILGVLTLVQLAFYGIWMLFLVLGGAAALLGS